jgi:hypothetical protein
MKKIFLLAFLASMLLLGFASAVPICATAETTFVSGAITDQTNANAPVDGANVTVDCNGNVKSVISAADGGYSVEFLATECTNGDTVSVSATKDSLSGSNDQPTWYTQNATVGCLKLIIDVACVDVPLMPEFGLMIGALTIVGALTAFFVIRRK